MKMLFDFFPIALFFVAYKMWGIYVATGVAILASFAQVSFYWLKHARIDKLHMVTLGMITVLGGTTLFLQNPIFIKWKPTVVYWVFAAVFFGSRFFAKKPLIQQTMENSVKLPQHVWQRLNLTWVVFFMLMGGLNLYVVYHFDTNAWVNFKLFGILGLTLVFILLQAVYMARYAILEDTPQAQSHEQTEPN